MTPILLTEEYWRNSHLSIARFYGGIIFNSQLYVIVNKDGITLAGLSDPESEHYVGDGMTIPPGEPADLLAAEWVDPYKALGRDRIIELVKEGKTLDEVKQIMKEGEP